MTVKAMGLLDALETVAEVNLADQFTGLLRIVAEQPITRLCYKDPVVMPAGYAIHVHPSHVREMVEC